METEQLLQRLFEVLDYNPESGVFHWKVNRGRGVKAGDKAGTVNRLGYLQISVDNKVYAAHTLAFLILNGRKAVRCVDHIDQNKLNNAAINLREADQQLNTLNNKARGTHYSRDGWCAGLTLNGKRKHLGYFKTEAEAHDAYFKAKNDYLRRKHGSTV